MSGEVLALLHDAQSILDEHLPEPRALVSRAAPLLLNHLETGDDRLLDQLADAIAAHDDHARPLAPAFSRLQSAVNAGDVPAARAAVDELRDAARRGLPERPPARRRSEPPPPLHLADPRRRGPSKDPRLQPAWRALTTLNLNRRFNHG